MRTLTLLTLLLIGCVPMPTSQKPPEGKPPSLAVASRVDQVGRAVVAANPFTGLDVGFQVIGRAEPLIAHRDRHGIFISEGLVDRCQTDGELAAVICLELGKMMAEERTLARMGYSARAEVPVPDAMGANDLAGDPVRLAEAVQKHGTAQKASSSSASDPQAIAAELLKTAGHDVKLLETVKPYLKDANADKDLLRYLVR
jgi:hypothetical protein